MGLKNFEEYVDITRWTSYFVQLQSILEAAPEAVLEIGVGHRVLNVVLKSQGIDVTGMDIDPALKPDVVGDVRQLSTYFPGRTFDAVCAFEVLEHLPFEYFQACLTEMAKVSNRYVIISVPYFGLSFRLLMIFARRGYREISFGRRIPLFWRNFSQTGEHYWELGWKDYPMKKIKRILNESFRIMKVVRVPPNFGQILFVLEKR